MKLSRHHRSSLDEEMLDGEGLPRPLLSELEHVQLYSFDLLRIHGFEHRDDGLDLYFLKTALGITTYT